MHNGEGEGPPGRPVKGVDLEKAAIGRCRTVVGSSTHCVQSLSVSDYPSQARQAQIATGDQVSHQRKLRGHQPVSGGKEGGGKAHLADTCKPQSPLDTAMDRAKANRAVGGDALMYHYDKHEGGERGERKRQLTSPPTELRRPGKKVAMSAAQFGERWGALVS